MNRIMNVMRIHARDRFSWFYLPWIILMSSYSVNLIISYFLEEEMYTGGLASIYIYMLVAGMIVLPQTFPFALGFSVRRKDYMMATGSMVLLASAGSTLLLALLSFVESDWTGGWGTGLYFFHLPYWSDGSFPEQIWNSFAVMVHMFSLGFVISSIHRRFGRTGMYVFFIASLVLFTIIGFLFTYLGWWLDLYHWLQGQTIAAYALWIFLIALVYAGLSYLMIRKATV